MESSHGDFFVEPRPDVGQLPKVSQAWLRYNRPKVGHPRLLACVDHSDRASLVTPHALALACSLGLEVTFARVIETSGHFSSPADPIEWQTRQHARKENLRQWVNRNGSGVLAEGQEIDSVLLAGTPADELTDWARNHEVTLLCLSRKDEKPGPGLGSTAQALLDNSTCSLLVVPSTPRQDATYRRIMVPIDGSARSESVLPLARRIARTHGATLLLVRIVTQSETSGRRCGDLEHNAKPGSIRSRLGSHTERSARDHLERLRARSVEDGVAVRAMTIGPGDPCALLTRLTAEQEADLVVMSSHGSHGLEDAPCGRVTEHLAGHAAAPVLIVRPNIECSFGPEPVTCRTGSAFRFS